MTIRHQYFCSEYYTSAKAMTPLHGGAASELKSMTHPHWSSSFHFSLVRRPSTRLSYNKYIFLSHWSDLVMVRRTQTGMPHGKQVLNSFSYKQWVNPSIRTLGSLPDPLVKSIVRGLPMWEVGSSSQTNDLQYWYASLSSLALSIIRIEQGLVIAVLR